ncbi:MAG TPA: hypothetical protein VIQ02_05580 [Jiangellaceae bacterium]
MPTAVRKSIPIDPADRDVVQRIRTPGSPEHEALRAEGVELSETSSEAEALHALLVVGRRALEESVLEAGYARLATAEDDEDREFRRAISQRAARLVD